MKKAIILLLCLAVVGGGGFFGYKQYQKSRDEKRVVDVVPVGAMASPYYGGYWGDENSMYGATSAANAQRVQLDTEKLVKNVCVTKGQQVKKGDVILEYDMTVVELELAQKENDIQVIQQDIKMANNKLAEIRNYQPSENAPQEPDEPDEPDIPDEPDVPDDPVTPIELTEEVPAAFHAESGTGAPDDPIVINCTPRAKVYLPFMQMASASKRCFELRVYNDDFTFLYKWLINGADLKEEDLAEWTVTEGVTIDPETGAVSIDTNGKMHGQLSFGAPPQISIKDDMPEMPEDPPAEKYQMPDPGAFMDEAQNNSMDYRYSRAEINSMIKEQEARIKELNISLKEAQLKLENAKKQKNDGRVLAEIDGIVKKIGSVTDGAVNPDDPSEKDPFAEPSEDDQYFAVIEGDGGMEVVCTVMEMNLPRVQPGTVLEVMSYSDGASSEAVVTSIDPEPISYNYQGWGSNPNNSSYRLHAKLQNSDNFMLGVGVSVTIADEETQENNTSLYLPPHYLRREGGDYYVLKADENDRLVKQYVSVGATDYYVEVKGGLSMKDRICFPYGPNAKEGVRTNDTDEPKMPEGMYY